MLLTPRRTAHGLHQRGRVAIRHVNVATVSERRSAVSSTIIPVVVVLILGATPLGLTQEQTMEQTMEIIHVTPSGQTSSEELTETLPVSEEPDVVVTIKGAATVDTPKPVRSWRFDDLSPIVQQQLRACGDSVACAFKVLPPDVLQPIQAPAFSPDAVSPPP